MNKTRQYFLFIASMISMLTFLPLANVYLPRFVGSYHVWALLWGLSILLFAPKVLTHKTMFIVGIYGFFLLIMLNTLWKTMDDWNVITLLVDYYSIAVAVSIICYFDYKNDYEGLAKLTKYTVIFIIITAVLTIFTSFIDPMYSRSISLTDMERLLTNSEIASLKALQKYGGGARADGFGLMALIPLLIYYFQNEKLITISKKWIVTLIVLFIIASTRMQFTALMIFSYVLVIMSMVQVKQRKKAMVIFSIISTILFFIPNQIYVNLLYNLSDLASGLKDLSFKIQDMADYIEYGGGIIEGNAVSLRLDLRYSAAIDYFMESPIFGFYFLNDTVFDNIGIGHLFLMNKLVVSGLVGFLLWGYIFFHHLKIQIRKMEQEYQYFFILASLSIILYGLVKVIMGRPAWFLFFVIIPGMYYLPLLNKVGGTKR